MHTIGLQSAGINLSSYCVLYTAPSGITQRHEPLGSDPIGSDRLDSRVFMHALHIIFKTLEFGLKFIGLMVNIMSIML
jgi:hypothetical protein